MKKMLLLLVTCLVSLAGCDWSCCSHHEHAKTDDANKSSSAALNTVIEIKTTEDFEKEVLKADKPVVADFSAPWCGACQTMKPLFEELAKELSSYKFVAINVDVAEKIAQEYEVKGIPMFAFFNAGKEVDKDLRIVGAVSKDSFKKAVAKAFAAPEKPAAK